MIRIPTKILKFFLIFAYYIYIMWGYYLECMSNYLLGKSPLELSKIAMELGLPSFVGKQIANWLYKKRVLSIDEMTNISLKGRELLKANYQVGRIGYSAVAKSSDGTKKYLFKCNTGTYVESVMIPDKDRYTLCVSSQGGCKMGCKFCMTGRQGFSGNLSVNEIISQFLSIDEADNLTNAVFMGMGEPLDNLSNVLSAINVLTSEWGFAWSPKRITLSSIGVTKSKLPIALPDYREDEKNRGEYVTDSPLRAFLDLTKVHLAISLHNPFAEERVEIMPMEKAFPLRDALEVIKEYDFTGQRRVSFEYIMFNRVNDSKRHSDAIVRLLKGLESRVNLIRFHAIEDTPLTSSPMAVIEAFRDRINSGGVTATIRASRGEDILAACGMLAGKKG